MVSSATPRASGSEDVAWVCSDPVMRALVLRCLDQGSLRISSQNLVPPKPSLGRVEDVTTMHTSPASASEARSYV